MGKRSKKTYTKEETFAELMLSAEQALAYERGAREGYRVTQVTGATPSQPDFQRRSSAGSRAIRNF